MPAVEGICSFGDLIHELLRQLLGRHPHRLQVVCRVDEGFVDGIHVNVPRVEVVQIQRVDICCVFDVELHPGHCCLILHVPWDVGESASILDPFGLSSSG